MVGRCRRDGVGWPFQRAAVLAKSEALIRGAEDFSASLTEEAFIRQ